MSTQIYKYSLNYYTNSINTLKEIIKAAPSKEGSTEIFNAINWARIGCKVVFENLDPKEVVCKETYQKLHKLALQKLKEITETMSDQSRAQISLPPELQGALLVKSHSL